MVWYTCDNWYCNRKSVSVSPTTTAVLKSSFYLCIAKLLYIQLSLVFPTDSAGVPIMCINFEFKYMFYNNLILQYQQKLKQPIEIDGKSTDQTQQIER